MALLNFDVANAPKDEFEPLPAGWYNVECTASEIKPTRDGNGSYLNLTYIVLDGPFAKRMVFDRFTLNNQNPTAVRMGQIQLANLCRAINVHNVQDTTQLHNRPFQARLAVREAVGDYGATNDVKGYKAITQPAIGGGAAQAPQPAVAPVQPAVAQPSVQQPVAPQPGQPAPWAVPPASDISSEDIPF